MIFIPKVNWPKCPHCGEGFLLAEDFKAHLPSCSGLQKHPITGLLQEIFENLTRDLEERDE